MLLDPLDLSHESMPIITVTFPERKYGPPKLVEFPIISPVSPPIPVQLGLPVILAALGNVTIITIVPMPKTPSYVNDYPVLWQDNVGLSRQIPNVFTES